MSACCNSGPSCGSTGAPQAGGGPYRSILWIALLINAAMFVVEIVAGLAAQSVSLKADALDFLADAANYGISLTVLGMALQWRARAALFKGVSLGVVGLWVVANTIYNAIFATVPHAEVMSFIGLLALAANVIVAVMLYTYRRGDANMRSVWLCSRNDAIGNICVMIAAAAVWFSGTGWPDIAVAAVMAYLSISAALQIVRQAMAELQSVTTAAPAE